MEYWNELQTSNIFYERTEVWASEGDDKGLDSWLERKFGCSALRLATPDIAHKAITALKAMTTR